MIQRLDDEATQGVDAEGNSRSAATRVLRWWKMVLAILLLLSTPVVTAVSCVLHAYDPVRHMVMLTSWPDLTLGTCSRLVGYIMFIPLFGAVAGVVVSLLFMLALALLWSHRIISWTFNATCQLAGIHFHQEFAQINSQRLQFQQQLDTLHRETTNRMCKCCFDAIANSILIACGHVDLCMECVQRLEGHDTTSWFAGECPEYGIPCQLHGTSDVHCLICRGGGARRKVFFA